MYQLSRVVFAAMVDTSIVNKKTKKEKKKLTHQITDDENRNSKTTEQLKDEVVKDNLISCAVSKIKKKRKRKHRDNDAADLENTSEERSHKKRKKDADCEENEANQCIAEKSTKAKKKKQKHRGDDAVDLDHKCKEKKRQKDDEYEEKVSNQCIPEKSTKSKKSQKIIDESDSQVKTKKKKKKKDTSRNNDVVDNIGADITVSDTDEDGGNIKRKKKRKHEKMMTEPETLHAENISNETNATSSLSEVHEVVEKIKKKKKKKAHDLEAAEDVSVKPKKNNKLDGAKVKTEKQKKKNDSTNEQNDVIIKKKKDKKKEKQSKAPDIENDEIKETCSKPVSNDPSEKSDNVKSGLNNNTTFGGSNFGQWATAGFDDNTRKDKFMRLLGGFKKGGDVSSKAANVKGLRFNMAMDQEKEKDMQVKLSNQYAEAMGMRFKSGKGGGLGFEIPPEEGKKFYINTAQTKSKKFDD